MRQPEVYEIEFQSKKVVSRYGTEEVVPTIGTSFHKLFST